MGPAAAVEVGLPRLPRLEGRVPRRRDLRESKVVQAVRADAEGIEPLEGVVGDAPHEQVRGEDAEEEPRRAPAAAEAGQEQQHEEGIRGAHRLQEHARVEAGDVDPEHVARRHRGTSYTEIESSSRYTRRNAPRDCRSSTPS